MSVSIVQTIWLPRQILASLHIPALLPLYHMPDRFYCYFFFPHCFLKLKCASKMYTTKAENCQVFAHHLFWATICILFTLFKMHYLSQNFHFRAVVRGIIQLIFDHMNKECWTSYRICIHTSLKFAFMPYLCTTH